MIAWYRPSPIHLLRHKLFRLCLISLSVVLITTLFFNLFAHAAPSTTKTINFSARLKNSSGGVVPDGHYNVSFRIYNQANGGTPLWTETYSDTNGPSDGQDNRVSVSGGYLSVKLGSLVAFGSSINWDDDLWMTMNIGGTSQIASPDWDGEMSPRIQLAAVPYAISAGSVGGKTADDLLQLGQGTQTDASDNSSISINKTGTGNLMHLQSSGNDAFILDGNGNITLGGITDKTISIGTANGGLGHNLAVVAGGGEDGGSLVLQGGNASGLAGVGGSVVIDSGSGSAGGTVDIGTASAGGINIGNAGSITAVQGDLQANNLDSTEQTALAIGQSNATSISLGQNTTVSGDMVVTSKSNGQNAFSVQNSANESVLNVSTSGTGNTLTLGSNSDSIKGSLGLSSGGGQTGSINTSELTEDRTYTLPDESGVFCLQNSPDCGFIQGNGEVAQDADLWITGGGAFGSGVSVQTTVDSAQALEVKDADGNQQLRVDTINDQVVIGAIDNKASLLVLDTKTTSGDPAGINGAMYYNSSTSRFRCYEGGDWKDCITPLPVSKTAQANFTTNKDTPVDVDNMSFALAANTKYYYKFVLIHESEDTATGSGFGITAPSGITMSNWCINTTAITNTASPGLGSYCGTGDASATTTGTDNPGNYFTTQMEGYIHTGATAGDLKLRFKSEINSKNVTIDEKSFGILQIVQ